MKKKFRLIFFYLIVFCASISTAQGLENEKSEFGFYFGTKIYEERHPVDNSFLA